MIGADGLIGRTIEAGSNAARVLLLTDPASRIPVIVVRTGQAGLAVGTNRPALELRDRVGLDVPLQTGDRLVTIGDGGIFPPGVPVGTIIAAGVEPPQIRPAATPVGAGFVIIESAFLPLPRRNRRADHRRAGADRRGAQRCQGAGRAAGNAIAVTNRPA